jgi:hypothetical protein
MGIQGTCTPQCREATGYLADVHMTDTPWNMARNIVRNVSVL